MQNTEEPGSQVQGTVLEPCKVAVRMDMGGDAGDIQLTLSDLRMNLSPDVLELALSVQSSVLEPLVQPAPDRYVHQSWAPSNRLRIAWMWWAIQKLVTSVALATSRPPA